jgi:septal ring factor EnvC (AmiA/AmiB activator)
VTSARRAAVSLALVAAAAIVCAAAPRPAFAQSKADARKSTPRMADPKPSAESAATAERQRQLQAEQRELKGRLAQLKKQLAESEANQSEAADALADSEAAISAANRRLRELAAARRQVERQIAALQDRGRAVNARQSDEERELGLLLRAQFVVGRQSPWQRLLAGGDPNDVSRDVTYLAYLGRARAQLVGQLRERRQELAELEAESVLKQAELATIAADEQKNRVQLVQQQAARKRTLVRLSRQITGQRQSIASLAADEKRLSGLIDSLARLLAEQARQRARRAAAEPAPGRAVRPGNTGAAEADLPSGSALAAQRGKLPPPVKGEVVARFGAARRGDGGAGATAPTWKGVFFRAPEGADVHAIAAGRVVFADWLRGFGNLLILDHGDGLLSVYGNNEALLAGVGERVEAGAVVAAVGNTGGNPDPGLYFEIRVQGRPVDPLSWVAAR